MNLHTACSTTIRASAIPWTSCRRSPPFDGRTPCWGRTTASSSARAIRGFQEERLDRLTGLPAYVVDSKTGRAEDHARGVGLSFMLIWAAELWPQTAESWYGRYEKQFWQEGTWFAGFREFPHDVDVGWFNMADVDAGL